MTNKQNRRIGLLILIISAILITGCVSTKEPVNPEDVIVSTGSIVMKEFNEKEITVDIINNATESIDSVVVNSFEPFEVLGGGQVNVPGKKEEPMSASLIARVRAPGFKDAAETSMLSISYASGINDKGDPVVRTKSVPVQTTVLPDAKLQFVGFVKGIENISDAEVTTWELNKGENATITFSTKNEGRSTIDENTLTVLVDVENKRIGTNKTVTIKEAMAKGGTSFTKGVVVPVLENAPNGETDVTVTLLMGDDVLDTRTLLLIVKL